MTTLSNTLEILDKAHLVEDYEHFSKNYVDRNGGWLSYQLHKDRDFCLETAIITLRNIRKVKTFYLNKRHSIGGIVDEYIEALTKADRLIQAHIENKYGILEIKQ